MKRNTFTFILLTIATLMSAQGLASFKPEGAITETHIKDNKDGVNSIVETIVYGVDSKNIELKHKLYGGCTIDAATPLTSDFTNHQTVTINKRGGASKTWDLVIHNLEPAKLPVSISFSKNNPCDFAAANPKCWAGYGIDYTKPTVARFGNSGVGFFVAFEDGAKEVSFELTVVAKEQFDGEMDVEWSEDGKKWKKLKTYSAGSPFQSGATTTLSLPAGSRMVRWVYAVRERQNINLNNITIK